MSFATVGALASHLESGRDSVGSHKATKCGAPFVPSWLCARDGADVAVEPSTARRNVRQRQVFGHSITETDGMKAAI